MTENISMSIRISLAMLRKIDSFACSKRLLQEPVERPYTRARAIRDLFEVGVKTSGANFINLKSSQSAAVKILINKEQYAKLVRVANGNSCSGLIRYAIHKAIEGKA